MTGLVPVGDDDLQAYIDKRLAPGRADIVTGYLSAHPAVATKLSRIQEQNDALRASLQEKYDEPIPPRLRVASLIAARRLRQRLWFGRSAAAAMLLLVGGVSGWYANELTLSQRATPMLQLADQAVRAFRTFSVEKLHPVEVRASDEGHLIQWLSNRLDRQIVVPDLSRDGFRLMGGRVLPGRVRPAAQIMYDDDKGARLTIYLQPMAVDVTEFRYTESADVRTFYRAEQGLAFAVTARVDRNELFNVARDIYVQITALRARKLGNQL